ncbi:hypothetical protein CPB83DRAFT_868785 [Crepidotus variabilis]|uniref:Uncharacterized protein n=1 Tax=Crepidotus variabilis TaxID=179855 RepID=A0A9P6JS07_9AGAR|nr:hypothetical protein CPB83DRAFT_868785 [Crepidotus variabilis]
MDKFAEELAKFINPFDDMDAQLCCFAHSINLIAKIFISFFFVTRRQKLIESDDESENEVEVKEEEVDDDDESVDGLENEVVDEEDDETTEAEQDDADEGQGRFNEKVTKKLREKAIAEMRTQGYKLKSAEIKSTGELFPKIAGLARRVNDSGTLKEKFDRLVTKSEDITGSRTALSRQVPTCWNSEMECLVSYMHFKDVVEQLLAVSSLKLGRYKLSSEQWSMTDDVSQVLMLFEDITQIFSQAEVPLIVDVLPSLYDLRGGLEAARDDSEHEVADIVRVACHASILVANKYLNLIEDNDFYLFTIVMCPDRKLRWFKDHGRTIQQVNQLKSRVIASWEKSYKQMGREDDDFFVS